MTRGIACLKFKVPVCTYGGVQITQTQMRCDISSGFKLFAMMLSTFLVIVDNIKSYLFICHFATQRVS